MILCDTPNARKFVCVQLSDEERAFVRDVSREAEFYLIHKLKELELPEPTVRELIDLVQDALFVERFYDLSFGSGILSRQEHKNLLTSSGRLAERIGAAIHPLDARGYVISPKDG